MLKVILTSSLSLLLSSFIATPAFSKPDIDLKLESKKVVIKHNKEIFEDSKKASPGETILYTLTVTNKGDSKALEVEPEGDIPSTTTYIPEKTDPKYKVQFSIDNGKTYQAKPKIKEKQKGKDVLKDAPISKYNKIKWFITALDVNKSVILTYKVKVK